VLIGLALLDEVWFLPTLWLWLGIPEGSPSARIFGEGFIKVVSRKAHQVYNVDQPN